MFTNAVTESPVDMQYFFNVNHDDVRELRAHLTAILNATIMILAVFVTLYALSQTFIHDVSLVSFSIE